MQSRRGARRPGWRLRSLLPALGLAWGAVPLPAAAVETVPADGDGELSGLPVIEIVVDGAETVDPATVTHYLGLRVAEPYEPTVVDRGIRELWRRELVEQLAVAAHAVGGGVRIVVTLAERPRLAAIEYRGLGRLGEDAVARLVASEGVRLVAGEPLRRGELERLRAALQELFRQRGFPLASATAEVEPAGTGHVRVVLTVDAGERLRVAALEFDGNTAFGDGRLRRAVRETRPTGPVSRPLGRDRFDRAALARDLERVRDLYRRAGYKDAELGEPSIEPVASAAGRRVSIRVPVSEGRRWRLGGISFTGNQAFSDERLLARFERPAAGWLSSRRVEEGVARVRALYRGAGHLTARVEPLTVERPGGVADLVVRITEGERYRVGRVEIAGNSETRDEVIRRELAVREGEVLDAVALERGLERLGRLGYFELDPAAPVEFELDAESATADLTLRGHEADPTRLFFGGGYGGGVGLFGQVQYSDRNFLGRGETLRASVQAGSDVEVVEAGYLVPWWLDRPQSLGFELFARRNDRAIAGGERIASETAGARLSWSRRLAGSQSLAVTVGRQRLVDSRRRPAGGDELLQALERDLATARVTHLLDRTDRQLAPSRGVRLRSSLELAGGALGGDGGYLEARLGLSLFRPLTRGRRAVVALNLEGGGVRPVDGGSLSFADRFSLGGENSVRGFRAGSILARGDGGERLFDADGFQLGGDRFLEASLELQLALTDWLRLVAFTDAGRVWAEGQRFDLAGLRRSAGLELRVTTPLAPHPLRLIWAHNLDPLDGDAFDSFQVGFGVSF